MKRFALDRRTIMKATGATALLGFASDSATARSPAEHSDQGADREEPQETEFIVRIDDQEFEDFKEVDLPCLSFDYGTGGEQPPERPKAAARTEYDNLTMTRGAKRADAALWDWADDVRSGDVEEAKRTVEIIQQESGREGQIRWEFTGALPAKYSPPKLEAGGDSAMATEELEITFERYYRRT